MPESVESFAERLRAHGFVELDARTGPMDSGLIVFRREPIQVRIVEDRGQWSVDLTSEGWPEGDWVSFPLFHRFALEDLG